jgi:DNA-binding response OmpR family regulator
MAATTLGQRGYLVNLAGDVQGALACAVKVPPDLVISTVGLPGLEGWAWWERMRTLPALGGTPIIFLTGASEHNADIRGFDGERDERLDKPFRIEDLERLVARVLARLRHEAVERRARGAVPEKPSAGHRPLSAMRGNLDQIGIASVLVLLEMEHKTGILLLERQDNSARLFLRKGRVIRAELDGLERGRGAAAVYEVLDWSDGHFDFLVGDVGGVDEIQTSTTFLLIEGARRSDEKNHRGAGTG